MINTAVDLTGKEFKVGDKVAYGDTTSTNNAIICYGEVVEIQKPEHAKQSKVLVRTTKHGAYDRYYNGKIRTFIFPRNYHNLIIL